ncbi:carboxypeptidase-like regulatory domain-containing protein [uncultured Gimesia sp.]|uniref:carboxypeptidase-like regulatory domain-containing protein n=1 Tax=uncultured Gimesia sp. TaxID=1678688 RepID=UPI0030DACB47|tara:strand:- start:72065 stop:72508 length:444 start_codon:yes stop_codon:yes gene_type:complete
MHFYKFDQLNFIACLLFMTALLVGCSGEADSRPAVEIKGTITLDGAPLQQASIQFTSPKTGESAYANLDADGNYSISFPKADIGAEYEISVTPPVVEEENAMALAEIPKEKTATKIPAKYSNRSTSGLKTIIKQAGSNEADFELKSK